MRSLRRAVFSFLSLASIVATAASDMPAEFLEIHDWQIVCDNTRTCRAAGYSNRAAPLRASILLLRPAGPNQAVEVDVQLAHGFDAQDKVPTSVQLAIDGQELGLLSIGPDSATGRLTQEQVRALLRALPDAQQLTLHTDAALWTIGTAGARDVLLKMDEFQGRLDTAAALIQKGGKPESGVLPALPIPILVAPALSESEGQVQILAPGPRAALIAELGEELKDALCEAYPAVLSGEQAFFVHRLSKEKLLVETRCSVNEEATESTYWIMNAAPPFHPVVAESQGTRYQKGVIVSSHKLGALGDCIAQEEKTWDCAAFVLTSASSTGMCRRIGPSGAWTLPTVVIEVRRRQ